MKTRQRIVRLARLTIALAGTLVGCARADDRHEPPRKTAVQPTGMEQNAKPPLESEPLPPMATTSLYEVDKQLTDEDGQLRGFDEFRGHLVLVAMYYATCTTACPMLIKDLQDLMAALTAEQQTAVRVLLISFDPTRDTPAKRTELRSRHKLDPASWRVAAALPDDVRELAAILGLRYRSLDSGEFFHTSLITLLDDQGVPLARVEGLGRDRAPIVNAISGWLSRKPTHP